MRFGSVCSGIEAASMAWSVLGWEAAFFSEIEKFPSAVLGHHYPHVPNHGDMTKFQEWPEHAIELLVGGTPCQSFSVAGLRAGLADPRGNLMLTYLAIAARYRPRWLVWENVPGVLSSNDGRDFGTFLRGLAELGYGFAYRVLDAQFCRAHGYERAVPQRRRRVFVVGYLGDWRRAAAVLFDAASLRGDSPPRREAGQRVAPAISSRPTGGGGLGTDFDLDGGLLAHEVAPTLNAAFGSKLGLENQHIDSGAGMFVAHRAAPSLTSNPYGDHESREGLLVAHALRAEGFDASEDGTGRGTPIVPVAQPIVMMERGRNGEPSLETRQDGTANAILTPNGGRGGLGVGAIAYGIRNDAARDGEAKTLSKDASGVERLRPPGFNIYEGYAPTLDATAPHAVAHAIQAGALRENPSSGPDGIGVQEGIAYTVEARAEVQAVQTEWAVRRLTPVECARLQGFPDDYLSSVTYRGKPPADGPMYKALGNSMAVSVMRAIGTRIAMIDAINERIAA